VEINLSHISLGALLAGALAIARLWQFTTKFEVRLTTCENRIEAGQRKFKSHADEDDKLEKKIDQLWHHVDTKFEELRDSVHKLELKLK